MQLEIEHIKQVCYEVRNFSDRSGLRFRAMPVIEWEFADIHEYMRARVMLKQCLTPDLIAAQVVSGPRVINPHCEEIELFGVTFRLICHQMLHTPYGEVGAARAHMYFAEGPAWPPK